MDLRAIHIIGSDGWEEVGTDILWSDIVGIRLWI
jgi:hypothetical protein